MPNKFEPSATQVADIALPEHDLAIPCALTVHSDDRELEHAPAQRNIPVRQGPRHPLDVERLRLLRLMTRRSPKVYECLVGSAVMLASIQAQLLTCSPTVSTSVVLVFGLLFELIGMALAIQSLGWLHSFSNFERLQVNLAHNPLPTIQLPQNPVWFYRCFISVSLDAPAVLVLLGSFGLVVALILQAKEMSTGFAVIMIVVVVVGFGLLVFLIRAQQRFLWGKNVKFSDDT